MIDFATLQGLTIPEGVVAKIEDAAGNVLWRAGVSEAALLNMGNSAEATCINEVPCEDEK